MQENYLAKWLNNELSDEELAAFKKSAEYASYLKILEASNKMEAPEFDVDQAWNTFKNRASEDSPKVIVMKPFKQFLRVAAVVAVMIAGSYLYIDSLNESFTTQMAERTEVVLPDNSELILNADSKVTFSEKKWDKKRTINLEGEAFFKVAKGNKFTVSTDNGTVSVLGTQFNVENRKGFFEVTCYEGLVSVSYKNIEKKLSAGSSFVVINGKIQSADDIRTAQPSWMNNESSFKSIPLKYVLEEFERQFDIAVRIENVDTDQLFTGTFSNTDLNLALESISAPSQISYNLGEDNVLFYAENTP